MFHSVQYVLQVNSETGLQDGTVIRLASNVMIITVIYLLYFRILSRLPSVLLMLILSHCKYPKAIQSSFLNEE